MKLNISKDQSHNDCQQSVSLTTRFCQEDVRCLSSIIVIEVINYFGDDMEYLEEYARLKLAAHPDKKRGKYKLINTVYSHGIYNFQFGR